MRPRRRQVARARRPQLLRRPVAGRAAPHPGGLRRPRPAGL